jgi:hypothetical protein
LVVVRFGKFDGEEGLDAGVQVEGFASPAGPDGVGVGMVEAVHRGELITLALNRPEFSGGWVLPSAGLQTVSL